MKIGLPLRLLVLMPALFCMAQGSPAVPQEPPGFVRVTDAPLKTAEIVDTLVKRNQERAQALHSYAGTRVYKVKYRGFPSGRDAEMVIDVKYQSPATKEFTIRSATGSSIIVDKVFNKLLQAEKEALATETQTRAALNNDNYKFTQVGYQETSAGLMYVLSVEPRRKDKFLYQGRIWVDAGDFAVTRLEAKPAKNPSFWTKNSDVEEVYTKVGEFWLPMRIHSVSEVRLGGTAELTIQYNDYRIGPAEQVKKLSKLESPQEANFSAHDGN
jgi:outer membrane lipoprotein-sorting protein